MRVFISSTCYDLIDVRAEVEAHLRDMGLTPILSDSITSDFRVPPDVNSIEACLANIRSSDEVICILSKRYGPKLGEAFGNVSATHLEWKEARDKGIPIRMYVRDRLDADFSFWKKNKHLPKAPALPWVEDEPDLLSFFAAHRKLVDDVPATNWFWAFRHSVDLKARLTKDFGHVSSRAIMNRWLSEGRLPSVRVIPNIRSGQGPGNLTFKMQFSVSGNVPALDFHYFNNGTWTFVTDSLAGPVAPVALDFSSTNAPTIFEGDVLVKYTTPFGATIQDTFGLRCDMSKLKDAGMGMTFRLKSKKLLDELAFTVE